jgi:hypothetical protein
MKSRRSPSGLSLQNLVLRLGLILTICEGLLTLIALLRIPADTKNALLGSLSLERLILLAGAALLTLAASALLLRTWLRPAWFACFQERLRARLADRKTWGVLLIVSASGVMAGSYHILLTPEITEPFSRAYFERLLPLLGWFTALSAQTLLALPLLRFGADLKALRPRGRTFTATALIFGGFLLLWVWIAHTRFGLDSSDIGAGWYALGTPVLETQLALAWLLAISFAAFGLWLDRRAGSAFARQLQTGQRLDWMLSLALWLFAFLLWNAQPLQPSWFAAPPRPPNFSYYPNSDALLYDTTAQSVLTGAGFKTLDEPFALRPGYALFLAILHALGGVEYEPLLWMQIAVLAGIPVCFYWLTRLLHNRLSALIAALLITLREANAIVLGDVITNAHAKLFMSDLPATLGVLLFLLLVVVWLARPAQRPNLALIAGGLLGFAMLIRPEIGVLLPIVVLLALPALASQKRDWLKGAALITAGVVLALAPWIWRNYQITGTIFLDSPHYRADLFAKRYLQTETPTPSPPAPKLEPALPAADARPSPTPTPLPAQPGETSQEFASRLFRQTLDFVRQNARQVLGFITNHFINSQVQTVLYLPAAFRISDSALDFSGHRDPARFWQACCSAEGYVRRLPFWFDWDGSLPRQSLLPLLISLALVSGGIAVAWQRSRFAGLLPLAASLGYTGVNALVRNSGGRYILPVDWAGMFFFAIGLAELTLWGLRYFRAAGLPAWVAGEPPIPPARGSQPRAARLLWISALFIVLMGALLPLAEIAFPTRYPPENLTARLAVLPAEARSLLDAFTQNGGQVQQGRALYPRFQRAGLGEAGSTIPAFYPQDFARVSFYMVGPLNTGVVLPQAKRPADFANGADVVVLGCQQGDTLDALAVAVYTADGALADWLLRSPLPAALTCPLTAATLP